MNYWSRQDTKAWIAQLEDRLEDISHYLDKTLEWCDAHYIEDEKLIFLCSFLTCIWVSQLRDEPISYTELMEMLGITEVETEEEKLYELDAEYIDLTHTELLHHAVTMFREDNND
jgi:hypothetical protein